MGNIAENPYSVVPLMRSSILIKYITTKDIIDSIVNMFILQNNICVPLFLNKNKETILINILSEDSIATGTSEISDDVSLG